MSLARQRTTLVGRQTRLMLRTVLVLAGGWPHCHSILEIWGQGTSSQNSPSRHTKLTKLVFIRQFSHSSSQLIMPKRKATQETTEAVPAEPRRRSNRLQKLEDDGSEVASSKETNKPTNPPTKKNSNNSEHALKKVNSPRQMSEGFHWIDASCSDFSDFTPLSLFLIMATLIIGPHYNVLFRKLQR